MLKTIRANIKLFMDAYKSTINVYKANYQWEECNLNGITYYKAKDHVKMYACAFGAATKDIYNRKMILTDEYFELLTDNGKAFIIAHEVGHIVNGHLDGNLEEVKKANRRRLFKKELNKFEKEADEHAVKLLGKEQVLNALNELYDIQIDLFNRKDKEVQKRIAHIKTI